MKTLLCVVVATLCAAPVYAQTAPVTTLATPIGHEVNFGISGYNYIEPGDLKISISGAKVSGEYTLTLPLHSQKNWFVKGNARINLGSVNYDGWCAPWIIVPESTSPNGYALDLGPYSPCQDVKNKDWYFESRGLIGNDFVGPTWGWSFETGLGVRYLSNGINQIPGFRTDMYLYLPFGVTARTKIGSKPLAINAEYDQLLHGSQHTYNTKLGGGAVPPTATTPAFSIDGITDMAFKQHSGWALRGGVKFQIHGTMSLEPYYIYWRVAASPVSPATATFTVNGITVNQQFGAIEPLNYTHEGGVKLVFKF